MERVTAWQGIKLCDRDVKDVSVFSLSKGHECEQINIKLEKNTGNPDIVDAGQDSNGHSELTDEDFRI